MILVFRWCGCLLLSQKYWYSQKYLPFLQSIRVVFGLGFFLRELRLPSCRLNSLIVLASDDGQE